MRSSWRSLTGVFVLGLCIGIGGVSVSAGLSGSVRFQDVPVGSYYDTAIGELYDAGVIKGNPDGTFRPGNFVTRAEVAVMLKRLRDDLLGIETESEEQSESTEEQSTTTTTSSRTLRNPSGSIRFTIDRFSVQEDVGSTTISVIRAGGDAGAVAVTFTLSGGIAIAGEDFVASTGLLQFARGETSRTFTIQVADDELTEEDETFTILLSDPTGGAELGVPSTATVIIKDDESASSAGTAGNAEGTFIFSALSYSMAEDAGSITIMVMREEGSVGPASVDYATSDGTARSLSDYEAVSGTLDFADGEESKTFIVTLTDDSSTEGKETIRLTLTNPAGGAELGDLSTVDLFIIDDEVLSFGTGALRLTESEYDVREGSPAVLTIERVGGALGDISVEFDTTNGTAKAGQDYEAASGSLLFREGETTKTFSILTLDDDKNDPSEKFTVTLSNPTGGAVFDGPSSAVITILQY